MIHNVRFPVNFEVLPFERSWRWVGVEQEFRSGCLKNRWQYCIPRYQWFLGCKCYTIYIFSWIGELSLTSSPEAHVYILANERMLGKGSLDTLGWGFEKVQYMRRGGRAQGL